MIHEQKIREQWYMNKKLENIKACKLKKKWQENHWWLENNNDPFCIGEKKKICGERGQRDEFGRGWYGRAGWRIEEIVWKIKNISVGFFFNS